MKNQETASPTFRGSPRNFRRAPRAPPNRYRKRGEQIRRLGKALRRRGSSKLSSGEGVRPGSNTRGAGRRPGATQYMVYQPRPSVKRQSPCGPVQADREDQGKWSGKQGQNRYLGVEMAWGMLPGKTLTPSTKVTKKNRRVGPAQALAQELDAANEGTKTTGLDRREPLDPKTHRNTAQLQAVGSIHQIRSSTKGRKDIQPCKNVKVLP